MRRAEILTGFAAGQVKLLYVTGEPAKQRGTAPVSMIVVSTKPVDYLET